MLRYIQWSSCSIWICWKSIHIFWHVCKFLITRNIFICIHFENNEKNLLFFPLCIYRNSLKLGRSLEYTIWPFVLLFSIITLSFMSFPYIFLHLLGNVIWKIAPFIEAHLCDIFKIVHKTKETSCWNSADENCHC